jgi:hypothetical protein
MLWTNVNRVMKELTDKIKQIDLSIAQLKRMRKKIEWKIEQWELQQINQLKIKFDENTK